MISKSESIRNSINIPQAGLADLERNLGSLSLQYMRQSLELPLNHEKQTILARLYSAANTLHQSVREGIVENAIFEISSNLIGCEQVALLVMSKQQDHVDFIGSAEFNPTHLDILRRNAKRIIEEAPADLIFIETAGEDRSFLSSLGIHARIPFVLDSATKGAIVFFELLPQRNGLDAGDQELLKLLCAYIGPCLAANKTKHQETFGWMQL
jgi:nitrate/nitrite-specific signal transduction histidine kinase